MKFPIEWYEKNLLNMRKSSDRDIEEINNKIERLNRSLREIDILSQKIDAAKSKGKPDFDDERFMKNCGVSSNYDQYILRNI